MARMAIPTMVDSTINRNRYNNKSITTTKINRYILLLTYTAAILTINHKISSSDFWENWAGNAHCLPKRIYTPNSKSSIIKIITKARTKKVPIRVVGSGHAWSELVCTQGYILNTQYLNKILHIDKEKNIVHAEGGITIKSLNKELRNIGLVLSNQTYNEDQSIAGAISTASHGGGHTGTLSDFIEEIELIDSNGNTHFISQNQNSHLFSAAKASLGALGVIYSLKLRVEPYFSVSHEQKILTWKTFTENALYLHKQSDYSLFMIDPLLFNVLGHLWKRTNKTRTNISLSASTDGALRNSASQGFLYGPQNRFIIDDLKHLESEIAIPIKQIPQALTSIKKICHEFKERGFVPTCILCRFVEKDTDVLLSPTTTGACMYIGAIVIPDRMGLYEMFFQVFNQALIACNGRPHWGKINDLNHEKIRMLYGKNIDQFNQSRAVLDPHNIFSNPAINDLLGTINN